MSIFLITRAALPRALPIAVLLLGAACRSGPTAEASAAASAASEARDTVFLPGSAVTLAGLVPAQADSAPWRESWTAPARLILDPANTQALGAIAEGRVSRVLVRVGDHVRAGQLLATIHSHEVLDARSALAAAIAADGESATALRFAESAAGRASRLYAIRALSQAELEQANASLAQAQARRTQARAELARAHGMLDHVVGGGTIPAGVDEHEALVRSPIDGDVVALNAQPGAVVLVGAPLVTVSRTTSLILALQLPEHALSAARPGASVEFTVAALPGSRFTARVARVAPTIDSVTRTVEVQAQVLGGDVRLRAEMYATAELLASAGAPTLVVPASAIQALEGDTVVVTAQPRDGGMLLEAVKVRVGRRSATRAEILAGLATGTPVVAEGAAVAKAEILRKRGGE